MNLEELTVEINNVNAHITSYTENFLINENDYKVLHNISYSKYIEYQKNILLGLGLCKDRLNEFLDRRYYKLLDLVEE